MSVSIVTNVLEIPLVFTCSVMCYTCLVSGTYKTTLLYLVSMVTKTNSYMKELGDIACLYCHENPFTMVHNELLNPQLLKSSIGS